VTFGEPRWLAVGFLACLGLLWMWRRYDVRQRAALTRFISPHLREQLTQSVSVGRRRAQRGLSLAALALLFVALAGPLVGFRWELISRRGNDIVFAVDTSRSMSTPDVKPDRLTRAKLAIDDFTNQLDGDAVGLVAFAGGAFLVCPITLDYGAFHESLAAVDTNTIPRGGTNITSAIREAQAALRRRPGSDKILILVTDGEDLEGDAVIAAKAAAQQDGLRIYTIGVGTPQGDLIPVSTAQGSGFVKDDTGAFVKSRLDEPALKAIAAATGGLYAPLGAQGQGFETIYKAGLAPLLKHDVASRRRKVYIERYQWPLAASLGLLLTSLLIGTRRRVRAPRRAPVSEPRLTPGAAVTSGLALLLLSFTPAVPSRASTTSAEDAYKKGDYVTAQQEYAAAAKRDPKKPVLQFNAGTAAYRAGQFPQAAQAFQESISRAPSGDAKRLADQEDAYYNLGNTLYRTGQKTEQSSPQQTMQTWTQAVKAYDTALELRPDDADSKYNRDFVKRKIKDLQQNPPQNQPQGQPQGQPQNSPQGNQQNPQNQPPNQQQNPPPGQQPPPNQQPPNQQPPKQPPPNQPPPGQQPPQNSPQQPKDGAPPGQQPPGQPPGAQQPPPNPQQPNQPPPNQPPGQQPPPSADQKPGSGQPKPAPGTDEPQDARDQDDTQHAPGEMSREEARQLLDSQKSEERHAQGLPVALRQPDTPPDKPIKDW
jgi:Ca-activated chloride channel homolog